MESEKEKDAAVDQDNTPNIQQSALTVCSLILAEIQRANDKYPAFFVSAAEAQGVLARNYQDMVDVLSTIRSSNGYALDQVSLDNSFGLKDELVQLAAMCIKAAYSLTNLQEDCERFSETLRQQQVAAEILNAEDPAED